jgi:phosphate-selective porin OprO/OprP
MKLKTILLGTAASALLASPALAQSTMPAADPPKHHHHVADGTAARLDHMERLIEEQQAEIKDLKAQVNGGSARASAPQQQVSAAQFEALQNQVYEQAAAVKTVSNNAGVTLGKNGRPVISSADGRFTFSPRADVMGDWASYSKNSIAGMPIKKSGENFRRAQIGFQGKFAGDFAYKFMYDFGGTNGDEAYQAYYANGATPPKLGSTGAGSGPHVKEAWVSYTGVLAPFTLQIGALPPPANLGDATSSDDLMFNERASGSQISRSLGGDDGRESVGFTGYGSIWNASAFLTGDSYGKGALIAPSDSQEAIVGRVAIAPWQDPDTNFNVHFGANGTEVFHPQQSTSAAGATTSGITFSDRPEMRVDNFTLLNTGAINAKSAYAVGLEAALSYGPFLIEGENFWYGVDRYNPAPGVTNPNFSGWYVEGSWVLTGEPRKYNMQTASFTRPSPSDPFSPSNGNWGAWELAGRYSSTNLDYQLSAADHVIGGDQTIWSVGLNFYPNDILKFMFDWQDVNVKNITHIGNDAKYDTISVRTQVTF